MIESIGEHFNFNGHKWEDMTKIVIGHIISSFEGHKEETWGKKIIDSRSKSFKYDGNNKKTIKKQNYQKKKSQNLIICTSSMKRRLFEYLYTFVLFRLDIFICWILLFLPFDVW